jgi:hypothetical protein
MPGINKTMMLGGYPTEQTTSVSRFLDKGLETKLGSTHQNYAYTKPRCDIKWSLVDRMSTATRSYLGFSFSMVWWHMATNDWTRISWYIKFTLG